MVLGMQNLCQFGFHGATPKKQITRKEKCSFMAHWMSDIGHFLNLGEPGLLGIWIILLNPD